MVHADISPLNIARTSFFRRSRLKETQLVIVMGRLYVGKHCQQLTGSLGRENGARNSTKTASIQK